MSLVLAPIAAGCPSKPPPESPPPQSDGGTPPPESEGGTPPPESDGGTPPPESDGGTPPPESDGGAPSTPPQSPLANIAYTLVSDSSGTTPATGTNITLLFEPGGKALILAANDSLMLGHHGTWSYVSGQLTMAFTASDFHPNATFAVDLLAAQVTMPFQVFSTDPGSSTWTSYTPDLLAGGYMAAYGVVSDPVAPCVSADQVIAEAAEYISGRTGVTPVSDGIAPWPPAPPDFGDAAICNPSGTGGGGTIGADAEAADAGADADDAEAEDAGVDADNGRMMMMKVVGGEDTLARFRFPGPAAVQAGGASAAGGGSRIRPLNDPFDQCPDEAEDGGEIDADGGTAPVSVLKITVKGASLVVGLNDTAGTEVMLTPFTFLSGGVGQGYQIGFQASDPRTALVPDSPHNDIDDPPNKTAVIVNPYYSTARTVTFDEDQSTVVNGRPIFTTHSYSGTVYGFKTQDADIVAALSCSRPGLAPGPNSEGETCANYNPSDVTLMEDANATVSNITQAFLGNGPVLGTNPGVVEIFTHGDDSGGLTTADVLGCDLAAATAKLGALRATLRATYPSALYPFPDDAVEMGQTPDPSGTSAYYYAGVTPAYWAWLAKRGVDLSRSLVYVSACLADQSVLLRQAIGAKAYVAFNGNVTPAVGNAVGLYLPTLMARPTFGAEEAFYNIIRVSKNHQFIYKEDNIFSGLVDFSTMINGYGSLVPYFNNGALNATPTFDGGQLWILMWAARWGQNTIAGAANLLACYDTYWYKQDASDLGGLADPFCQNANGGLPPTEDEVAYAIYALSGAGTSSPALPPEGGVSFSGTFVPRFTLNDGQ
jgi:hypothetical protein